MSSIRDVALPSQTVGHQPDTSTQPTYTHSTAGKIVRFLVCTAADVSLIIPAGLAALYAYCLKPNLDPAIHEVKKDKTPILFIHGNGYNEMQWVLGRYFLSGNDTIGSMFSLNVDGLITNNDENGIDDYAKKVATKVEKMKALTGQDKVILVGHSMGGLIATYYAEKLAANTQTPTTVDRVVTISTPWEASSLLTRITQLTESIFPSLFKNPKRYQQMRNENGFLTDLKNLALGSKATRYYSLYSTADAMVSEESGALAPEQSVRYNWLGHYTPMLIPSVWKQVKEWVASYNVSSIGETALFCVYPSVF